MKAADFTCTFTETQGLVLGPNSDLPGISPAKGGCGNTGKEAQVRDEAEVIVNFLG